MNNILQQIAVETTLRIEKQKQITPPEKLIELAKSMPIGGTRFESALRGDDISFICEVKKASPSKGIIAEDFDHVQIAKDYAANGAAAISVLTEPFRFKGADSYLSDISKVVETPLLRKDFVVDEYMLYEAKVLGASAVLLICAILDTATIAKYIEIADSLGLCSLVETHDESEVKSAINAGARIIGVNNRNLKTFEIDLSLSERLRTLVPADKVFVAESGISTREDVERFRKIGANAVLVGEALMRGIGLKCLK